MLEDLTLNPITLYPIKSKNMLGIKTMNISLSGYAILHGIGKGDHEKEVQAREDAVKSMLNLKLRLGGL